MRIPSPGYEIAQENRHAPKAFSYFYSLLPRDIVMPLRDPGASPVANPDPELDPVEFRLRPMEARDFPVKLHEDSQFFHHYIKFEVANEYALILNPMTNEGYPGGVYMPANSNTVNGVGTSFRRDFRPNQILWINEGSAFRVFTIREIISDTVMRTVESTTTAISSISEPVAYGRMVSRNIPVNHFMDWKMPRLPLSGTVSTTAGSAALTGVGTSFTTQLFIGAIIQLVDNGGIRRAYRISAITSDTVATLSRNADSAATAVAYARLHPSGQGGGHHNVTLTGDISYLATAQPINITGRGTLFTTELVVGDKIRVIDNSGTEVFLVIQTITDDLTAVAFGQSGAAATNLAAAKFYTDYSDISFTIIAEGGGGQRVVGQGRVLSNQGSNGGGTAEFAPGGPAMSAIRRPYLYAKAGMVMVRVQNLTNDPRRIHASLFGLRIRI